MIGFSKSQNVYQNLQRFVNEAILNISFPSYETVHFSLNIDAARTVKPERTLNQITVVFTASRNTIVSLFLSLLTPNPTWNLL